MEKKTFFVTRLSTIFKQKCSYLRPLLSITFPQGFRICKNIGHPTLGSLGKKTFKRYLKSEHTDTHTNGRTDRRTNRLIESIGPEGRCFENRKGNIFRNLINVYLVSSKKKLIGSPNFLLIWREHRFHPLLIHC